MNHEPTMAIEFELHVMILISPKEDVSHINN